MTVNFWSTSPCRLIVPNAIMLLMADPVFTSGTTSVLHADPDIEGCWADNQG